MNEEEHGFWDYTPVLDELLRGTDEAGYFRSQWNERLWQNIPGPIYTGATDTCGTGYPEAPANVLFTEQGQEFIAMQPRTPVEVQQVMMAARVETFIGYARDGNEFWTVELIRQWWARRSELLHWVREQIRVPTFGEAPPYTGYSNALRAFEHYLQHELRDYLRYYAWFLEVRRGASDPNRLPEID